MVATGLDFPGRCWCRVGPKWLQVTIPSRSSVLRPTVTARPQGRVAKNAARRKFLRTRNKTSSWIRKNSATHSEFLRIQLRNRVLLGVLKNYCSRLAESCSGAPKSSGFRRALPIVAGQDQFALTGAGPITFAIYSHESISVNRLSRSASVTVSRKIAGVPRLLRKYQSRPLPPMRVSAELSSLTVLRVRVKPL